MPLHLLKPVLADSRRPQVSLPLPPRAVGRAMPELRQRARTERPVAASLSAPKPAQAVAPAMEIAAGLPAACYFATHEVGVRSLGAH
jgi:hypothetical protein